MQAKTISRISVVRGDIAGIHVDAIVNAANNTLLGGGGVDGAIHRAAGPALLAECRAIGGCPTGEARITDGYNLPARFVIHTVGPVYQGTEDDAVLLAACYRNSLKVAAAHSVTSIAFPAISCGVYRYPPRQAAAIAIKTVCRCLEDKPKIEQVCFVLFTSELYDIYIQYTNNEANR